MESNQSYNQHMVRSFLLLANPSLSTRSSLKTDPDLRKARRAAHNEWKRRHANHTSRLACSKELNNNENAEV